jgi:hypothetical protein
MPERTEKLREYQTLYEAWSAFSLYHFNFKLLTERQRIFKLGVIPFCTVLSIAALLSTLLNSSGSQPILSGGLRAVFILVPITFTILIVAGWQGIQSGKWLSVHRASEAIRSEIYRFRVSVGTSSLEEPASRNLKLEQHVLHIRRHLAENNVEVNELNNYHGRIPPETELLVPGDDGFSPLTPELYAEIRLRTQIKFKQGRISSLRSAMRRVKFGLIASGLLGTVLAALDLEPWIVLTAMILVVYSLHQEYTRLETELSSQLIEIIDLRTIERWWNELNLREKSQPAMINALVEGAETILTAGSVAWVPRFQAPSPAGLASPQDSASHHLSDGAFYGPTDVPDAASSNSFIETPRDNLATLEDGVRFPFESYLADEQELDVDDFLPGILD